MEKKNISNYLETKSELFGNLGDRIWECAETLFEETESAEILCKALEEEGFEVERGAGEIPTAFIARYGKGEPAIGFLGEYDALSNLSQQAGCPTKQPIAEGKNGHACGHNLLGVGALAGAFGLKKYLEQTGKEGRVIYYGCPAEEGGSGKAYMARAGCFDECDVALTWHPGEFNRVVSGSSLANFQVAYRYKGISAHAAVAPHLGRSALDAVELMNVGVQFLREHVVPEARIHYAITNTGGFSPNVVQPTAEVLYLMRAPVNGQVAEIYERINKIARGAALMTETELEVDFIKACSNIVPNNVLERVLYRNLKDITPPGYSSEHAEFYSELAKSNTSSAPKIRAKLASAQENDLSPEHKEEILSKLDDPIYTFLMPYEHAEKAEPASTDVGDVSWVRPTVQMGAATWVAGTLAHTWQATAMGKSDNAHKAVLYAGCALAHTAIDLLNEPDTIAAAKAELFERLGGIPYVCPIPPEVKPRKIRK